MTGCSIAYGHAAQADACLKDERILALVQYGEPSPRQALEPRLCRIPLTELGGTGTVEIWRAAQPTQTGALDGVGYVCAGEVAFLQVSLAEPSAQALQELTALAYRRLLATAHALGYPHFLRIWNYFPDINHECGGLERYRAFCAGRHAVLATEWAAFETQLPAASAIGTDGFGLRVYALAARAAGIPIENPRQVSAFRYPPQYGQRSPSFARATLKAWSKSCEHLYVSGTASIVGHASQHEALWPQLEETLANLEVLLAAANRRAHTPLQWALLKIYLRSALDPAPLRARIAQACGQTVPLLFLQGAICRQELLLEIEGVAQTIPA